MTDERLKMWLAFWKWFLSSIVITGGIGITTILINAKAKETELQIQIDREEKAYLTSFVERAIEDNLEKRHRFALYFASVSSSDKYKQGWEKYLDLVSKELEATQDEASEIRSVLVTKEGIELDNARIRLHQLEKQLEARTDLDSSRPKLSYFGLSKAGVLLNAEIKCPPKSTPAIWNETIKWHMLPIKGHHITRGCRDNSGQAVGPYTSWYKNGTVKQTRVVATDGLGYITTTYYQNGQKANQWKILNNTQVRGTLRIWTEDGREQ